MLNGSIYDCRCMGSGIHEKLNQENKYVTECMEDIYNMVRNGENVHLMVTDINQFNEIREIIDDALINGL